MSAGRNDPCPCGSGQKYKHCCAGKPDRSPQTLWTGALVALVLLGGLIFAGVTLTQSDDDGGAAPANRVWSEAHGHWHDAP